MPLDWNTMRLTHPFCNSVLEALVEIGVSVSGECKDMAVAKYEGLEEGFSYNAVIFPVSDNIRVVYRDEPIEVSTRDEVPLAYDFISSQRMAISRLEGGFPQLNVTLTPRKATGVEILQELRADERGGYHLKMFSKALGRATRITILDGSRMERILGWRINSLGFGEPAVDPKSMRLVIGVKRMLLEQRNDDERLVYPASQPNLLFPDWRRLNMRYLDKSLPFDESELVSYNPETMEILGTDKEGRVIVREIENVGDVDSPPAPTTTAPHAEPPFALTGSPPPNHRNHNRRK